MITWTECRRSSVIQTHHDAYFWRCYTQTPFLCRISQQNPVRPTCSGLQEYVKLHQRYLVKGEEVLNEWHMEKLARRTGSVSLLHGPYLKPPVREVLIHVPVWEGDQCCTMCQGLL